MNINNKSTYQNYSKTRKFNQGEENVWLKENVNSARRISKNITWWRKSDVKYTFGRTQGSPTDNSTLPSGSPESLNRNFEGKIRFQVLIPNQSSFRKRNRRWCKFNN